MNPVSSPSDDLAETGGDLSAYRLCTCAEISALLRQLQSANVRLNLTSTSGTTYTTRLWALDQKRDVLCFAADPDDPQLQSLLESEEVAVFGYLNNIKVQFDVHSLVLVHGGRASALNTTYPNEVYRFQRRGHYRARPLLQTTPVARMRHPMIPDMELALRILDVSISGCALLLPNNVPTLEPGTVINEVQLNLNQETRFSSALRLHHITSVNADSNNVRLGCEMVDLSADAQRVLRRYVDQTQKLRRIMTLN